MSRADQDKWDARYREGAYADRMHPSAFLAQWLERLEISANEPRAVDVGCGSGRNSLYLARRSWRVDGVDISPVALQRLSETAKTEGLTITCVQADLEDPEVQNPFPANHYDLAIMVRYTNLPLVETLRHALKPRGYLIAEEHLVTDADVVGPRDPRFRVAPGALRDAAAGFQITAYREGIVTDPDGRPAALAQLVARARPRTESFWLEASR